MSKADRRKGNAQTASSSRAADLLLASGRNIPFIGFDSLRPPSEKRNALPNVPSATTTGSSVVEEIEATNIESPQIRATLKRLIKPDPLTKEKALRELTALLRQSTEEESSRDLASSFVHFATIYPALVTNASPAVRAQSTSVLSTFLQLLKRTANSTGLKQSLPFFLFSLCDSSSQVVESANRLLTECFPAERRQRLEKSFALPAIRDIALEIIAGKHRLVQRQRAFVATTPDAQETERQRHSRLTSQSLRMVVWVLAASNESVGDEATKLDLYKRVTHSLCNAQTINSLMGMDSDVKSYTLAVVRRLAEADPTPFLESKLPSILLSHLGAPEVPLCKHAFECFLLLARDERLFEVLKVEKAVVPKFLSLLRRKGPHWSVLETALLPSFALINGQLKDDKEQRRKWINEVTESFFEGEVHSAPVESFSKAFIEVQKYTFLNLVTDHELAQSQCDKLLLFVDTLLAWPILGSDVRDVVSTLAADYLLWLEGKRSGISSVVSEVIDASMKRLALNFANKLPASVAMVEALLSTPADSSISKSLCVALVKLENVLSDLLVNALSGLREAAPSLVPDNICAAIAGRIAATSSQEETDMLLHCLGSFMGSRHGAESTLYTLIPGLVENAPLCLRIIRVEPNLLKSDAHTEKEVDGIRRAALKAILSTDQRIEEDRDVKALVGWTAQSGQEGRLVADLLDAGEQLAVLPEIHRWASLLRECLAATRKASLGVDEARLSIELFHNLLATVLAENAEGAPDEQHETACSEMIIGMLREMKSPDIAHIQSELNTFLSDASVPLESVERLGLTLRAEAVTSAALGSLLVWDALGELRSLAVALSAAYLSQMLTSEESLLLPYALQPASGDIAATNTPARLLLDGMRRCAFHCVGQTATRDAAPVEWFLRTMADESEKWGLSCRLDKATTTSTEWKMALKALPRHPQGDSIDELVDFTMAITSRASTTTHHLPLSVIYALKRTLSARQSIDSTLFIKKLAARTSDDDGSFPPHVLPLLKFALTCEQFNEEDSQQLISIVTAQGDGDANVLHWLIELTRASALFTSENRAQYIVSLDLLLTEMRQSNSLLAGMEEWLFTMQHTPDKLRDPTSYAILRLCSKCIPHLLEVGSPIRDFINCGFITALQSCTEALTSPQAACANSLTLLYASACIDIYGHYVALVRLNKDRREYREIRQEWHDFFGPSATSFIMKWLLGVDRLVPESINTGVTFEFTSSLCAVMHSSVDAEMMLKAELPPANLEAHSTCFDGYPGGLRAIVEPLSALLRSSGVSLEVGLAAARVLKNVLLDMFCAEGRASGRKVVEGKSDGSESSEAEAVQSAEAEVAATSNDEQENFMEAGSVERRLPQFLAEMFLHPPENIAETVDAEESVPTILLCWWAFVHFLAELDPSTRGSYTEGLTPQMLSNVFIQLFAVMPDQPAGTTNEEGKLFEEAVNYQQLPGYARLREKITCHLYHKTCTVVPTLLRQWYTSLSSGTAVFIRRYTKRYVSPSLIRRELKSIGNQKRGHLQVKVRGTTNEVEALYKFEGHTIQLEIRLPDTYPLTPAKIQAAEKAMLDKKTNRRWLLQLEVYLNAQNGPILDGIMRWKRNIDQHLAGKEECVICMAVISATNSQTPTRRCRNCTKKFHPKCLEDWFRKGSSELPTCPLCRATFF